jgi:hypothetical protein
MNKYPAAGRVTGSTTASAVGGLPPLPCEPAAAARHPQTNETVETVAAEPASLADSLQESLDQMSDDVLEKHLIGLRTEIDAAHARFALAVRELDSRIVSDLDHGLTTVTWLGRFCGMTRTEASGTVKTSHAMTHMPRVTDRALAGAVPQRSLQLLGQARDRNPDEFEDHESAFADMATSLSVADLRQGITRWRQQVDYQAALADVEYHERFRSLYLATQADGTCDVRGTLPPELFHLVSTVIEAKVNPTFLDDTDDRTVPQRRADALGDICAFYLDHNDTLVSSSGEKPHITVTVDYETLKGQAERLPEIAGKPVTPKTVRRITCDAGIIPMMLGSDSEPLDVGRKTRTIPTGIRRALEQRDRHCTWDGCEAPASWCDAHHLIHWADGGDTSLGNLALLCRNHHTATHNRNNPADQQGPPPDP